MRPIGYYKKDNMILAYSPQWEIDMYGLIVYSDQRTNLDGRGDTFQKTFIEALYTKDSDLDSGCYQMYENRLRWLDGPILSTKGKKPVRDVRSVTRDFIIGLTFYFVMTHQWAIVRMTDYPIFTKWYRMTPGLWNWLKFIKYNKKKHLRRYERKAIRTIKISSLTEKWRISLYDKALSRKSDGKKWKYLERFSRLFGMPMYVKKLHAEKAYTINSSKVKQALLDYANIPWWNYAIRVMCNDHFSNIDKKAILNYKSKHGDQWSSEKLKLTSYLNPMYKYQPSRDFLWWLMRKEYGKHWRTTIL